MWIRFRQLVDARRRSQAQQGFVRHFRLARHARRTPRSGFLSLALCTIVVVGLGAAFNAASAEVTELQPISFSPSAETEPEPDPAYSAWPSPIPSAPPEGDPEAPPTPVWNSPDGSTPPRHYMPVAFVSDRDGNREIYTMYPDGGSVTRLTNHPADDREPDWRGTGSKILFSSNRRDSEGTTDYEVWVINADGSGLLQLTHNIYNDSEPTFSNDGLAILFTSDRPNLDRKRDKDIWKMNTDGTSQRRITTNTEDDHRPVWSPDPNLFVSTWDHWDASSNKLAYSNIQYMALDGTGQMELTVGSSIKQKAAVPSNGGQTHFFFAGGGSGGDIYVKNQYTDSSGSNYWRLTDHAAEDSEPTTDADAQWIIFRSKRDDADGDIYRMDRNGRQLVRLTNWPGYDGQPSWCHTAITPPTITPSPKAPDSETAPDPAAAVTLLNLTLDPTTVLGGGPVTGTVTLTGAAPTGDLTITLSSNSATATVPQTVTVPAGDTTAPFPITTTPTEATTVATITAVHGEVTKTADLTVEAQTPPAPLELHSLTLSRASIVGGRSATGRVTLTGAAPAGGIEVQLSIEGGSVIVPTSVTVLEGRSSATFTISTTAVSASATATIAAAYAGVTKTAQLTVTPRFEITNINNGQVLSGDVTVDVAVYDSVIGIGEIELKIDNEVVGSSDPQGSGATRSMSFTIQTMELVNGHHSLTVTDGVSSDTRSVLFDNRIESLSYDAIFDTSGADAVPTVARIKATVADPSASPSWRVEIRDDSDNVVRTFTGSASAANPVIDVTWDGKDGTGVEVPDGVYPGAITLSSGAALNALNSLGDRKSRSSKRLRVGGGRSKQRKTNSKAGEVTLMSDEDWPAVGPDKPIYYINKHRISDKLILISISDVVGGWPKASEYAKYIRGKCAVPVTLLKPVQTLVVTEQRMNATPALRARINAQLKERMSLIYVLSHGAPYSPGFRIGDYRWMSSIHPDDPGKGDVDVNGNPRVFDVSKLVAYMHYGDPDGELPPFMVWMDNCYSAGPYLKNGVDDPKTDDLQWARIFGIDGLGPGAFVGTYKWCGQFGTPHNGGEINYDIWRRNFWYALMVEGRNVQTAYNTATSRTPPGSSPEPWQAYKWWGFGHSSF